jgi:hypothetical protein
MADHLTDKEIKGLLAEPKPLPADYQRRLVARPKRGHSEVALDVNGENGSDFRIVVRQSLVNPLDFSVILGYCPPNSNQVVRLRRYNGKSHEHTNTMERETFYDFHIHQATQRYQASGNREDTFAEPTDRYADVRGAIDCLIADCSMQLPPEARAPLFETKE